jgi:hypothetical protein
METSLETFEEKSDPIENSIAQFLEEPADSALLCRSRAEFNQFLARLGDHNVVMRNPEDFTGRSSRGEIHSESGTFVFDSSEDYDTHVEETTIKFVG